jgi:hypothetical protein
MKDKTSQQSKPVVKSEKITVEGIYEGMVLPIEIYDIAIDFENWGKEVLKTGQQKLDAIVEKCRYHNMSNEDTRKLIDKLWKKLDYSQTHKRRLIADKYPELIHSKFANKPKDTEINTKGEATKMDASNIVSVVDSNSNTSSNQIIEDSYRVMDEAKNREVFQTQTQIQIQLPQQVKDLVIQSNGEPEQLIESLQDKSPEELRYIIKRLEHKIMVQRIKIIELNRKNRNLSDGNDRLSKSYSELYKEKRELQTKLAKYEQQQPIGLGGE